MYNKPDSLFTNIIPTTGLGRFFQFPIVRIFIALSFLFPVILMNNLLGVGWLKYFDGYMELAIRLLRDLFYLTLFMIVYSLYTRWVERRETLEFSLSKFIKELGLGAILSFAVIGFMVALMMVLGYYKLEGFNEINILLTSFQKHMMVGFMEELLFRIILFKLVEEFAGSWWALVVQGVLFGFAHLGNPNASVWTSLGLVADSTLLFAGAYMLTRRIWLVMGLHWSWNFLQSGLFNMPNSGVDEPGFFKATIAGPEWLTGGAFGIEASYLSISLNVLIGLYLIKLVIDRGQLVLPSWKRGNVDPQTDIDQNVKAE